MKHVVTQPTVFMNQIKSPVVIVGNLYGNYQTLRKIFETQGFPPYTKYIFLGCMCGRGPDSVEVVCELLAYSVLYPDRVFLLSGETEREYVTNASELEKCNGKPEEPDQVSPLYNWVLKHDTCFSSEILRKYGPKDGRELVERFADVLRYLPLGAYVDIGYFCMNVLDPKLFVQRKDDESKPHSTIPHEIRVLNNRMRDDIGKPKTHQIKFESGAVEKFYANFVEGNNLVKLFCARRPAELKKEETRVEEVGANVIWKIDRNMKDHYVELESDGQETLLGKPEFLLF